MGRERAFTGQRRGGGAAHSGRGGSGYSSNPKRRMFTKLVKDPSASIDSVYEAEKFIAGAKTFDKTAELLKQLTDNRNHGLQRINDVLSFVDSIEVVEVLLIGILRVVLTEESSRPLYKTLRNKVLLEVYSVPGLVDACLEMNVAAHLSQVDAALFCSFLMEVAKASLEARTSAVVVELSMSLQERGDMSDARRLCAYVLADEKPEEEEIQSQQLTRTGRRSVVACWVTDQVPPGGRHDNDDRNYRNIQIIPTAEELKCKESPYLPLASGENAFLENRESRLLDRNFRLLREDAVHSMRENISQAETRAWPNARIVGLDLDSIRMTGTVSFIVQCDHRRPSNNKRNKIDWKRSRALMQGSVVALCRGNEPVRLGTLSIRKEDERGRWLNTPGGPKFGVIFQSPGDFNAAVAEYIHNSYINKEIDSLLEKISAVESAPEDESRSLRLRCDLLLQRMACYDLVEASKSFFAYEPVLKTLQQMERVPLCDELVFARRNQGALEYLPETLSLPKDKFLRGYNFNLHQFSKQEIVEMTSLDESQAGALCHALTSRVAMIQGPPGTGKTFIGGLLARLILQNTTESILCVCYTNHALDQFLEHLIEAGEQQIVRIGGRTKSAVVERYQLHLLARHKTDRDNDESRRIKQLDAMIHKEREKIEKLNASITIKVGWKSPGGGIRSHLQDVYPELFVLLEPPLLEDGFRIAGHRGKAIEGDDMWKLWSRGDRFPGYMTPYFGPVLGDQLDGFWRLPLEERLEMIETWRRDLLHADIEELEESVGRLTELVQERKEQLQERDQQIIDQARVIGATTAGAAKYRNILSSTTTGVVIVEEAGEVLEAHILASLSEVTKHLIMIGDHMQLRPKAESYRLTAASKDGYDLDCSLFERLILSDSLPSQALKLQHRMHPNISDLVKKQTYPYLKDHESVHRHPPVKGVATNVVFIDHKQPEDNQEEGSTSKSNEYEAVLCVELVRFFLLQGYNPDQLVVLTPYLGQLRNIIKLLDSRIEDVSSYVDEKDQRDLEELESEEEAQEGQTRKQHSQRGSVASRNGSRKVRCSSVDNFQGEEADIVVSSLVRSNRHGGLGFLKEKQRVNVLLSRARHGMFLVGNSATLESKAGQEVWAPILDILRERGQFRRGLPTTCQLHPEDPPIELCNVKDFRSRRPNGGCDRPCQYRLPCGHVCPLMCHPLDRSHRVVQGQCGEPCKRVPPECPMGHPCTKLCRDKCGPCLFEVGPRNLPCGHEAISIRCHDARSPQALEDFSLSRCQEKVMHTFKQCNHTVITSCKNARSAHPVCPALCDVQLECGHPCQLTCGDCIGNHNCQQKCGRMLFCGHVCGRPCHSPDGCPPCQKKCRVRCSHSRCPAKCNEPCASCIEPCDWTCEHKGECPLVCGAPCARLPCNKRCDKVLSCGHQCPSVCGEECPSSRFCRECGTEKAKSQVVDLIELLVYDEHGVDSDPIIFLSCGHFFAISTLDGLLGMDEVYSRDRLGNFNGLKPLHEAKVTEKPKLCPECREPVKLVRRYGRLLRLMELRCLERKHMVYVDDRLNAWKDRLEHKDAHRQLSKILESIKKSPMRKIFEACGGSELVEVPPPPSKPLIRCLELIAMAHIQKVEVKNDKAYTEAENAYFEAIAEADSSLSHRSGAAMRIALVRLMIKFGGDDMSILRSEAYPHLDYILRKGRQFPDLVQTALDLRKGLSDEARKEEMKQVLHAMTALEGYNYGGSAASHWFECPNGHPYFIGECGGAMQTSRCYECGAEVGGGDHRLLPNNRQAGGLVADIFSQMHS